MIGEAERAGATWELHYGGRDRTSMAFIDELERYGDRVHIVTESVDGILDLATLLGTAEPDTLVYACGPDGLLTAIESYSEAWPADAIHLERFKAKERVADAGGDAPFRVVCEQSGVSATVSPEKTILETLEESGVNVPNSCREASAARARPAFSAALPTTATPCSQPPSRSPAPPSCSVSPAPAPTSWCWICRKDSR